MTKKILGRLTVVLALVAAPVAIAYDALATTGCPDGAVTPAGNGWTRIAPPSFTTGDARLTAYVVPPTSTREILATNGVAVARSADAGCTWQQVSVLPDVPTLAVPVSARSARITALYAPGSVRYAVVTEGTRLVVLRSVDDAATWTAGTGLLTQNSASATDAKLLVGSADGRTLYLVAGADPQTVRTTGRLVYVSTDAGSTWLPSPIPSSVAQTSGSTGSNVLLDLAVDGGNATSLYAGTSLGLLRSDDNGSTWKQAPISGQSIGMVVTGAVAQRASVLAVDVANHVAYVSRDDGLTWSAAGTPADVQSAAIDPAQFTAVVASTDGVYQLRFDTATFAPMWNRQPVIGKVSFDRSPTPYVYACSCDTDTDVALWRSFDTAPYSPTLFKPPAPPISLPGLFPTSYYCGGTLPAVDAPKVWEPSVLAPVQQQLTLAAGQAVTVPYHLHAAPREMDVYFLSDTGDKMEFALCLSETGTVVATNMVNPVRNLSVGLGSYREYPNFGDEWNSTASYTYRRHMTIGRPNRILTDELHKLRMDIEPDRAGAQALLHAVTGEGQDVDPVGPSSGDIAPNSGAVFTDSAFKVAMIVTGGWFNDPVRTSNYPGLPLDQVLKVLRDAKVHVPGVWINNGGHKQSQENQAYEGRRDLFMFAEGTDARTPLPLDCNRDGYADLRAAEGLVCDFITSDGTDGQYVNNGDPTLGRVMAKLLLALEDKEAITLVPRTNPASVASVTPPQYKNVELLQRSDHDFDVTFRCGAKQTNETVPVTIDAVAGGFPIAAANVILRCGHPVPPPVIHPAAVVIPPPPPPAPNPLPGPAPHPAPNPGPNLAPNPAQAPQAQSQPVAQGVPVVQQQKEPQLAFQKASTELQGNEAMSGLPTPARDPLQPARRLALLGGACLAAAAATARGLFARALSRSGDR